MPRFNFKNQPAYLEYSSWESRPEGLPGYEFDEDGNPIVAPGELYCRARFDTGEICTNTTKQFQPSNLRNHLKTTHNYTVESLAPGPMNAVDSHKTDKFYIDLVKCAATGDRDTDTEIHESPVPKTPIKTSRRRVSGGTSTGSSRSQEKHSIPRKKDGKPDGRTMRKMVGYTGRACDACVGLRRKATDCPPAKPDGKCLVWSQFKQLDIIDLEDEA